MWAPWFSQTPIEDYLRGVEPGTFMCDLDVAEQFLNFMLSPSIGPFTGVDLTPYFPKEIHPPKKVPWERWKWCYMGCHSSPYQADQGILFATEVIWGDHSNSVNIFSFDAIQLNLPGDPAYSPGTQTLDGCVACDLRVYVDDGSTTAPSNEESWQTFRVVASTLTWLGLQDAAHKCHPPFSGARCLGWVNCAFLTWDCYYSQFTGKQKLN